MHAISFGPNPVLLEIRWQEVRECSDCNIPLIYELVRTIHSNYYRFQACDANSLIRCVVVGIESAMFATTNYFVTVWDSMEPGRGGELPMAEGREILGVKRWKWRKPKELQVG